MVERTVWALSFCLLAALQLSGPSPANAQETGEIEPAGPAISAGDIDEARREVVRQVLERPEVRNAARVAGIDLDDLASGVDRLEGEPLARAAKQAEALDRRLAIDGTISSTTLIILLVATVLLIVLIQD